MYKIATQEMWHFTTKEGSFTVKSTTYYVRASTILVAVIVSLIAAWGSAPAQAAFPGSNGTIAFDSNRDGNLEIYSMNADGTNPTNLTNNTAADIRPAFSPDGSKIAFQSGRDGNDYEIYSMNADGTNPTRLTNNPAFDAAPAFSPDGSKLAFQSHRDGNPEIYSMNADGTSPTRLTNNPANEEAPDWQALTAEPTTAPTVTSTVPKANATQAAPTANVRATFSEEMDSNTIDGTTFQLFKKGTTIQIPATVSYNADTDTAKLDPTNNLRRGVAYKAVVTTEAKDAEGNRLDQDSSTSGLQQMRWFFRVDD
jgi:WD40 repeat protein